MAFTIAFLRSKSVILYFKTMLHFFKLSSYVLKKTWIIELMSNSKTAFSILNLPQFNSNTYFLCFKIAFLDFISHSATAFWIWKFPCCIFRSVFYTLKLPFSLFETDNWNMASIQLHTKQYFIFSSLKSIIKLINIFKERWSSPLTSRHQHRYWRWYSNVNVVFYTE